LRQGTKHPQYVYERLRSRDGSRQTPSRKVSRASCLFLCFQSPSARVNDLRKQAEIAQVTSTTRNRTECVLPPPIETLQQEGNLPKNKSARDNPYPPVVDWQRKPNHFVNSATRLQFFFNLWCFFFR
ncbi:unnamed protein product, partial [Ectocarpus sp. 4 AP-2014]